MSRKTKSTARATLIAGAIAGVVAAPSHGAFSGGNGRIAFEGVTPLFPRPGGARVYTIGPDGSGLEALTRAKAYGPSFSPDGSRLVYSSYFRRDGEKGRRIVRIDADGTDKARLTKGRDDIEDLSPSYAPSGRQIVFERRDHAHEVSKIVRRGRRGRETTLAKFRFPTGGWWFPRDAGPVFSPDGESIVFVRPRGAFESDLWIMDADGSDRRPLITGPGFDSSPDLSPDGTRILFTRENSSDAGVYVANADGSEAVNLIPGECCLNEAAFSPDGTKLVASDHDAVVAMGLDGSNRTTLLRDPQLSHRAFTWQPNPMR
jgi:Tol biopolymer transport system component